MLRGQEAGAAGADLTGSARFRSDFVQTVIAIQAQQCFVVFPEILISADLLFQGLSLSGSSFLCRSPSKAKRKPNPPTRRDGNEREDADEVHLPWSRLPSRCPLMLSHALRSSRLGGVRRTQINSCECICVL